MFRQKVLPALLAAMTLGLAVPASATTTVTIDPDGAGSASAITVSTLDWAPGSIIATGQTGTAGSTFTSYTQAGLSVFKDAADTVINSTGVNVDYEWTFVAGFKEKVTLAVAGVTLADVINDSANFYQIWYDPDRDSNQLTGKGFGDDASGNSSAVLILEASGLAAAVSGSGSFAAALNQQNPANLDQYLAQNYSGYKTATGNGNTTIEAKITYVNSAFFPGLSTGDVFKTFFTTGVTLPFLQTNPNSCYFDGSAYQTAAGNGITGGCGVAGDGGSIGLINGLQRNVLFQTDANQSFEVPEPGALGLLGLATVGIAAVGTRRRRRN